MKKKIIAFAIIAIIVLTVPLTLLQIQRSQDTRSRASTENIAFSFTPASLSAIVGQEFSVALIMNTNNVPVEAIDLTISFDKNKIELISSDFANSSIPDVLGQTPNNTTGTYRYVGIANNNTSVSGTSITITTLKFKGKTAGTAAVGFTGQAEVGSSNSTASLTSSVTTGSYVITAASACTENALSPIGCDCENSEQCQSGVCSEGKCIQSSTTVTTTITVTQNTPTNTPTPTRTPTPAPTGIPTIIPTATLFPTPVIGPNDTYLKFGVKLTGIGTGSDGLNNSPKRPQRIGKIEIFNSENALTKSVEGVFQYSETAGAYWGIGNLGTNFSADEYLLKVTFDNTLRKLTPGIITINNGENNYGINTELITGDLNGDNELNLTDYTIMIACTRHETGCTQ